MAKTYSVEAVMSATGADKFIRSFQEATGSVTDFKKVGEDLGKTGKSLTKSITVPVAAAAAGIVSIGSKYEDSMANLKAVSGVVGKDFENLESVARDLGKSTRYSATEAADAMGSMALAGLEVEEIMSSVPDVLTLASASGIGLAEASDIVTQSMNIFGIEAENTDRIMDVLAQGQRNSASTTSELAEALIKTGPAAAAVGAEYEDVVATLGLLADAGKTGSVGGTLLNSMFRDIQASAVDGAIAIGEHSVAVYDSEGNMRSMVDILRDMESATEGMSDEQRTAALSANLTDQAMSGVNSILGKGSEALDELTGKLYDSSGAAKEMQETMDDTLMGSMDNMKSAISEVAIQFYELGDGPFRSVIDAITNLVTWFGGLSSTTKQWIAIIAILAAAIGPLLIVFSKVTLAISTIQSLQLGASIASASGVIVKALGALMNPITLIIALIAAISAGILYLYRNNETFRDGVHAIWESIKNMFSAFIEFVAPLWNGFWGGIWDIVKTVMSAIGEFVNKILGSISGWFESNGELIREVTSLIYGWISDYITDIMEDIALVINTSLNVMSALFSGIWNGIKLIIESTLSAIATIIKTTMQIITGDWSGAFETMKSGALDQLGFMVDGIMNFVNTFKNAGAAIIDGLWQGISGAFSGLTGNFKGLLGGLRNMLPFSPPKDKSSPLFGIERNGIGEQIAKGIVGGQDDVDQAMDTLLQSPVIKMNNLDIDGSIADGQQSLNSKIKHDVTGSVENQPAYINLSIGGQIFRAFVKNISDEQDSQEELELVY